MKDNIFTYEGVKGELVETFYKLLATGDVVSYESILTEYDGGKLSTPKITAHNQYNTLNLMLKNKKYLINNISLGKQNGK